MPRADTPGRIRILRDAIEFNDKQLAIAAGFSPALPMMTWYLYGF